MPRATQLHGHAHRRLASDAPETSVAYSSGDGSGAAGGIDASAGGVDASMDASVGLGAFAAQAVGGSEAGASRGGGGGGGSGGGGGGGLLGARLGAAPSPGPRRVAPPTARRASGASVSAARAMYGGGPRGGWVWRGGGADSTPSSPPIPAIGLKTKRKGDGGGGWGGEPGNGANRRLLCRARTG